MNESVTVSLPSEILLKAEAWAQHSGRPLTEFLSETIESSLLSFSQDPAVVGSWSDSELLDAIDAQLSTQEDTRLSDLLTHQNQAPLAATQAIELQALMTTYQQRLLLKSAALREAVKRGLRESPKP